MNSHSQPTPEQLDALRRYAAEKGRTWKSRLNEDWMNADARIGGEFSPELQQVRNTLGPSWLVRFKLPTESGRPRCMYGNPACEADSTHAVPRYFLKRKDKNYYLCTAHAESWNKRPLQAYPAIDIGSLKS